MCPSADLPWLFLDIKMQTSEPSKNLGLKCYLSTFLSLKGYYINNFFFWSKNAQFQNKDYPWVETQVNAALGHINNKCHLCSNSSATSVLTLIDGIQMEVFFWMPTLANDCTTALCVRWSFKIRKFSLSVFSAALGRALKLWGNEVKRPNR